MRINFQDEKDAPPQLVAIDATTMNTLVIYCSKRGIAISSVEEISFGESDTSLLNKVGFATAIARHFSAVVHFSHERVPITAYPDVRTACFADYRRRNAAGERIENGTVTKLCTVCAQDKSWHKKERPSHTFKPEP